MESLRLVLQKKRIQIASLIFCISLALISVSCDIQQGMTNSLTSFYNGDPSLVRHLKYSKPDSDLIGTRFIVPRPDKLGVRVNLYFPKNTSSSPTPCVFNIHGGSFMEGSADLLDSQSARMSELCEAFVVNIDYCYADDRPIDYSVQEVTDTVLYFFQNAEKYNLDVTRFSVCGYSAGAYYAATAAVKLRKKGVRLFSQVLCYAYIGEIRADFLKMTSSQQSQVAPALFVVCSDDFLSESSLSYKMILDAKGVKTKTVRYSNARHGFIEVNNNEYTLTSAPSSFHQRSPKQQCYAREAETKIALWIRFLK